MELYDYQKEGVRKILASKSKGYMLAYEMGLGKSATAISLCKELDLGRILVICPALVRRNWEVQFDQWWFEHPGVLQVTSGDKAKVLAEETRDHVLVTSYNLLKHFKNNRWDAIIIDESHYIKDKRSARSALVKKICEKNKGAYKIALTGTPISNEPKDLWNQIDTIVPNALGGYWNFIRRHCNNIPSAYSAWLYEGLNLAHAEELREKVLPLTHRITKNDVSHLLPPFHVYGVPVGSGRSCKDIVAVSNPAMYEAEVRYLGDRKINATVDSAIEAIEAGQKVAVLAYYKETARKIKEGIEKKWKGGQTVFITGDQTVENRVKYLDAAKRVNAKCMVATICSINVGIDLTHFNTAIFGELYWQTACMIQAFGRFSRLNGVEPSAVQLLYLEGSLDELIMNKLLERVENQTLIYESGIAEKGMVKAFKKEMNEEDFLNELRQAANLYQEEEI